MLLATSWSTFSLNSLRNSSFCSMQDFFPFVCEHQVMVLLLYYNQAHFFELREVQTTDFRSLMQNGLQPAGDVDFESLSF